MSPARKMLINAGDPEEFRVAILEEGFLEDFAIEAASREATKGNIYKGVVANIEPSLQAAFVNYGGTRHGFLPLSEVHPDYRPKKAAPGKGKIRIQQALRKGIVGRSLGLFLERVVYPNEPREWPLRPVLELAAAEPSR